MIAKERVTIVDQIQIDHPAFVHAEEQIRQCYEFSSNEAEPEGLAIVGESGTGKTSVLVSYQSKYQTKRDAEGITSPIVFATVPPKPTVKTLAGELLKGIGEPLWERGTEYEKTKRLQVLMRGTGTKMVMIDEFQHFYDQDKQKMMYTVADWLKNLIKASKVALVVAGLPDCTSVINQNEQLRRLFLNPVKLPRFSWRDLSNRREFRTILKEFHKEMSKKYEMLPLHSEDMAFRIYCATGGLIGYVAKLLRQAERNAVTAKTKIISLRDLKTAQLQAVYSCDAGEPRILPFEGDFSLVVNAAILDQADKIGRPIEQPEPIRRRSLTGKDASLDSLLRKR